MSSNRILKRWENTQVTLLKQLVTLVNNCRHRGSDSDVHSLRVVTRRVRLLTRLASTLYGRTLSHTCRDWARHTATLTDPVRDLDVALEWLATLSDIDPAVLRSLNSRRQRLWTTRRPRLQPLPSSLLSALTQTRPGPRTAASLAKRCDRLQQKLQSQVHSLAPQFFLLDREAQHDFRRLVRRWRYLRELLIPEKDQPSDPLLQQLLRLQEALGDRQNLYLADAALAAMTRPHPSVPRLRQAITQALLSCEKTIRSRLKPFARKTTPVPKQPAR